MTTFAVYTNIVFVDKPDWLDEFKERYNQIKYKDHVTLIQKRRVAEGDIDEVKAKLNIFFSQNLFKQIQVTFNSLDTDPTGVEVGDGCIMAVTENSSIVDLQNALRNIFVKYNDYVIPRSEMYEKDFRPHITIVDNLNKERFELAKSNLKADVVIKGIITEVILGVAYGDKKEEFSYRLI